MLDFKIFNVDKTRKYDILGCYDLLQMGKYHVVQVPAFFQHKEKKPYKESYAAIRYYSALGNFSAFIFLLIENKAKFQQ